ncbi:MULTISPECIES: hypothetical protein [Vibrio]|nr:MULTISPECIES: hypothetical protein [Vibrio]MDE1213225.1 hypothetical protein [Vibrio aestuarianus]MDE1216575.1 hypothetical protein [Vibrio aestuarianus]MDE1267076.1 hypothetical protein [Vibrio aestuarianus]MDE1274588.1 hypothetical protein [Vibrio aestuarianus]MDE1285050.1 hypothetical protein [Vibrio aestuarianus]
MINKHTVNALLGGIKHRRTLWNTLYFSHSDITYLFNFNNGELRATHNELGWFKSVDNEFITNKMSDDFLNGCTPSTYLNQLFDLNRSIAKRGKLKGFAKLKEEQVKQLLAEATTDDVETEIYKHAFELHRSIQELNRCWSIQSNNNESYDDALQEELEILVVDLAKIIVMPLIASKLDDKVFDGSSFCNKKQIMLEQVQAIIEREKHLKNALRLRQNIDRDYNYTKKCFRECLDLSLWFADDLSPILSRKNSWDTFYANEFKSLYQDLKQQRHVTLEEVQVG